jgi:hypothetical protein
MPFLIGYSIPAGTKPFDVTKGGGPAETGVCKFKIIEIKAQKKAKVIQAAIEVEIVEPAHRAGEKLTTWENVEALPGQPKGTQDQAVANVTTLLLSTGSQKMAKQIAESGIPKGFDLEQLRGAVLHGFTREGDAEHYGEVVFLTPKAYTEVAAGDAKVPDKRRKKGENRGARANGAGTARAGAANAFDDEPDWGVGEAAAPQTFDDSPFN